MSGSSRWLRTLISTRRFEESREFGATDTVEAERDWIDNITITTGLVNATTAPELLERIVDGSLEPGKFVTHRFGFDEMLAAYDTFSRAAEEHALKVFIVNGS